VKGGLRTKIIAWSFVPTAIILVVVALVSLYAYQQTTESLVTERDRELTRLSAKLLANDLTAYTDPLADLFMTAFDAVIVFDADGTVLAAEPSRYESWHPNWLKNYVHEHRAGSQEPVFSDIVFDGTQGENFVVVVMATRSPEGRSAGGIAGLFRLGSKEDSALYQSVEKLRRADSQCIYLVDSQGRIIYHSTADHIGHDFSTRPVVELVQSHWAGAYRTRDPEGQEIVASFAQVPGTSWGLVVEENWADLTRSSRRFGQMLLGLLALGLVAPALIVAVGVRRITDPIRELILAAQEVAGGRFGQRITARTRDEVEELAAQFNLMAAQLQASYADLEQKVADRTKELATLNAIAAVVSQSLDLREILNHALDEVLTVMEMESGQAFRLEEETQTLESIAQRGLSAGFAKDTNRLPLGAGLAAQASELGKPVVQQVDNYPPGHSRDLAKREGLELVVSIPLLVHGRSVGAINLGSHRPRAVSEEELSLLAAIGHQIGVAVENARLYEQAQQLAVMKERNRLARDLHDSVTQALYGVTLYAEAAARLLLSKETQLAAEHLGEIRTTAQESLREMRLLIFELRLPMIKQDGLAAALQSRLEAVEGRVGLETTFISDLDGRLPAETEEGLYRIAQEALNNTLRHAQAQRVDVHLHENAQAVTLEIADDGIGFDALAPEAQGGFGLRGMAERAARLGGQLAIESEPGKGTRISVEVRP
jgi:nitrate/nitrite-specific signal transduction histidine kinase